MNDLNVLWVFVFAVLIGYGITAAWLSHRRHARKPSVVSLVHKQNLIALYAFAQWALRRAETNADAGLHSRALGVVLDVQERAQSIDEAASLETRFGPLAETDLMEFAKGVQRYAEHSGDDLLRRQATAILEAIIARAPRFAPSKFHA